MKTTPAQRQVLANLLSGLQAGGEDVHDAISYSRLNRTCSVMINHGLMTSDGQLTDKGRRVAIELDDPPVRIP